MKVSDAYSDLLRGEISGHGIAIEGSLQDKDKPRVLGYLNSGLLALYTRFPLLYKECRIKQLSYITTYKLNSKFAVTNTASREVKYIIDSRIAPFTDDVIRVEAVADEIGDVLERNTTDYDKVYLTPSMDAIEIPNPCKGNVLFVTYRAHHPVLTSEVDEILLPRHLLPALYAYVASGIYSGSSSQEHVAKTVECSQRYEMICQQVESAGMVNNDRQYISTKQYWGGWV